MSLTRSIARRQHNSISTILALVISLSVRTVGFIDIMYPLYIDFVLAGKAFLFFVSVEGEREERGRERRGGKRGEGEREERGKERRRGKSL
jgi:hypothetical protein